MSLSSMRKLKKLGCFLLLGGSGAAMAQPAVIKVMSYVEAQQALLERSDQLAASHKAVESARLRRQGSERLGGPSVAVTGMAYHYSANAQLDLDPARRLLPGVLATLPPATQQGLASLYVEREKNVASANLSLVWPLYLGGLSDAVRGGLDAATEEAQADAASSRDSLHSLLAQRYFGAQLAERAAQLRERSLDAVRRHDAAAQKMLEAGTIAQVERLQAHAALAEAEQQARKARDEADLADTALARTLKAHTRVRPGTPLFVSSQPLPPLEQFIAAAEQRHPGLSKVRARQRQAESLHEAQEALRRPQVLAFGSHDIASQGKPNWIAGLAVRWTLWDSLDREALAASSLRSVEQAELTQSQIRSDLALLV